MKDGSSVRGVARPRRSYSFRHQLHPCLPTARRLAHMRVLVAGGSGYIGSHVYRVLFERGDEPVIVDDFRSGVRARVDGFPS